jgi:hypothetical protein
MLSLYVREENIDKNDNCTLRYPKRECQNSLEKKLSSPSLVTCYYGRKKTATVADLKENYEIESISNQYLEDLMKSFKESLASVTHLIPVVVKTTDLEIKNRLSPEIIDFNQVSCQTTDQDQNTSHSASHQEVEEEQNPSHPELTKEDNEILVEKTNIFKRFWNHIIVD